MPPTDRASEVVEELEKLLAKSTPGPWEADTSSPEDCVIWASAEHGSAFLGNVGSDRMVPVQPEGAALMFDVDVKNAELIAALHNAAPQLIAIARAVLAFLPTCPTCGGTGWYILEQRTCPTCGPLRAAAGVK